MTDLFSKFDPLIQQREALLDTGLTDPFNLVMERVESPTVAICNGKRTILLGTYNYMGMTFDPDVIAAGKQALDEFGSGTTGSRVLNGTYGGHRAVEKRLKRIPEGAGKLVVLEGVYSMLGDIAPLKDMVRISKENGAMVLVDEAHSMGFIGEDGRGVAEAQGVIDDVDFIIGTFSKSVGTVGGFCVSNHPKFEILRLVCRPYVFTASLPPSVVATAATSIRKLMDSANKRAHLWENSKRLHAGLCQLGFTLGTEEPHSAIIAVIMPDLEKGASMWEALLNEGLYVNLARPPATPAGMTLLRCSLCALHTEEQVGEILGMFAAAGRATGCIS